MKVLKELLGGALLIESPYFEDERGAFVKFFNHDTPLAHYHIAQVNHVQNHQKGILRGLHYQSAPQAESKFFRVVSGSINLVFVDLRPSHKSFKKAESVILNQSNTAVLIPEGFATGYEVLETNTNVLYFSNKDYHPDLENGINWQDPMLSHLWHSSKPIVSIKDQNWKIWSE